MSTEAPTQSESSDLTIPLMLPKISSRTQPAVAPTAKVESSSTASSTIPLNLPKIKSKSNQIPLIGGNNEAEKPGVLSSLTEEDLIRKAAEMLGENESNSKKESNQTKKIKEVATYQPTPTSSYIPTITPPVVFNQPPPKVPPINLNTPPPNLTTLTTPPPILTTPPPNLATPSPNLTTPPPNLPNLSTPPPAIPGLGSLPAKRSKIDLNQPPIPGLEDET